MSQSNRTLQRSSTMSYLEGQLSAAQALKSGHEYRFWLLTYVRYLVQEGTLKKYFRFHLIPYIDSGC